jgi:DNA repair protein SbcD/Mre11
MSLRIVATADNHLGQYLARLPLGKLEERRRRLRHAFGRVFDYARDQCADLVVLAGDVFDTPNPRNTDRLYLARCLRSVAGGKTRAVAIGGNHDTPRSTSEQGGYSPLDVYAELGGLTFFDQWDPATGPLEPLRIEASGLRVAICGMTPTLSLGPEADPLAGLQFGAPDADVRILVLHGPVEGTVFPDLDVPIIRRAALEQLRDVDLVIVGDVHRFASFSIGTTQVVIPGATEWLNFGDIGATQPGFAVVEVRGRGISWSAMRRARRNHG